MSERFSIPVVGLIIERINQKTKKKEILIQKRHKPEYDPKYTGFWELPAGRIREFEDIRECIKRELKEETGLELEKLEIEQTKKFEHRGDKAFAFRPFCCEQFLKGPYPYIGFVFKAKVKGNPKGTEEARNIRWCDLEEIKRLINKGQFHPYHVGALKFYLNNKK